MFKRIFSLLLAVIMVVSMMPGSAYAEETESAAETVAAETMETISETEPEETAPMTVPEETVPDQTEETVPATVLEVTSPETVLEETVTEQVEKEKAVTWSSPCLCKLKKGAQRSIQNQNYFA